MGDFSLKTDDDYVVPESQVVLPPPRPGRAPTTRSDPSDNRTTPCDHTPFP